MRTISAEKATEASFYDPTVTKPETAIPFSITRNPRGVVCADVAEAPRTLVASRLNDRQRSNAGARMVLAVQTNCTVHHVRELVSCRQKGVETTNVAMHG